MDMKRLARSCVVGLVLAGASLSAAARSDVADAAMAGDRAAVQALLAQHADVSVPQADGATALHWAAYRQDLETASLLIRAGANVKAANREGFTPLALACINGQASMIETLLKAGADANERLLNGETALMMASRTGNVAAMTALLDRGADLNATEPVHGTTPLMWAASEGHPDAVRLLIERGADLRARSNPDYRFRGPRNAGAGRPADPRKCADTTVVCDAAQKQRERDRVLDNQTPGPPDFADRSGGGLTPLVFATRRNDFASVRILLAAGADVNQVTEYGWSPLLVATQNRYYQLGSFLLDKGADPNIANKGGWTPLYLAVDNRNIEGGDYPVRKGDMDHLDFIKKLLDRGADVNARMRENTETRTIFRGQWAAENGATAFWRASMSSDLVVMRLLLARGADPKIATRINVTALQVASGIGWVEGITYEWSEQANVEAVKLLLDLGIDPNIQAENGRTALHGAGHKGRTAVIQLLVDRGAKLDARDYGGNTGGRLLNHTWQPVDYADGLVRVGTQSAIAQPEAAKLLRKLMAERGLRVPPEGRTFETICLADDVCDDVIEEGR
jgi:ankyrin repeat protein